MGMGRPTKFNDEVAGRICEELMLGRSLRKICETEDWAPDIRTVVRWLEKDIGGFVNKYALARAVQSDIGADDLQDIADTPVIGVVETDKLDKGGAVFTEVRRADMIEHRRLRIDVRKWNAEKLRPKVYGAKQFLEHSGHLSLSVSETSDADLIAEIMELCISGRLKLPDGLQLEEREDDEDDFSDIA